MALWNAAVDTPVRVSEELFYLLFSFSIFFRSQALNISCVCRQVFLFDLIAFERFSQCGMF